MAQVRGLLPHQVEGVARIRAQGGLLLGDEPGLGKTAQAFMASNGPGQVLYLTLAGLKRQALAECEAWRPNARAVMVDGPPQVRAAQWGRQADVYIANYELLLRDAALMDRDWAWIVCDEATRLSNVRNKQYKALRKLRSGFRLAMTGTPVSNRPDDLFGILDWVRPGCLGSWFSFMSRYCVRNGRNWIVGYRHLPELAERVRPLMLRRLKEDVLDLPEKITTDIPFGLGDKEQRLYDQMRMGVLLEIERADVSKVQSLSSLDMAIVAFGKMRELCDSMELLGETAESTKLKVMGDLLSTLGDANVIVFTAFSRMADIIQRELGCLKITGATPLDERNRVAGEFNAGTGRVLVMTNAGEYGLNLQGASVIIHYDQPLSVARKEQREGRAHRMGQSKKVLVYNLVAERTVDSSILRKLNRKQDMSRLLLSDIREMI